MSEILAFDRFTIDRATLRLYEGGVATPVNLASLRLLLVLLENRGAVVTKAELITRVWGAASVSENTLHAQISGLRRIIGRHLIATRSGVGYRFAGKIKDTEPNKQPSRDRGPETSAATAPAQPGTMRTSPRHGLLGRSEQLRDLAKLLNRARFVTLTGPGGVGKTSLARALLHRIGGDKTDAGWFVELAAERDQAGVIDAVKAAMSIEGDYEASPLDELVAHLRPKHGLLILDNCEHLVEAVAQLVGTLIAAAPGLRIVATSRQALGYRGERIISVPPLTLPDLGTDSIGRAREAPALRLFTDRIAALDPTFVMQDDQVAVAARICHSLDGLPLALEIVASWANVLGLETLEAKLNAAPTNWTHPRAMLPVRQHDLRSTLAWSYDLLSSEERKVLRRLSVFPRSFTLQAAEPVAADADLSADHAFTHLAGLVRKSLVVVSQATRPPSYRLLETTRAFALERLREAGEEDATRSKHAETLLQALSAAEQDWDSTASTVWLARYAALIDDVRSALDWAIGREGDIETGLAIAASSWPLWRELSLRVEGARRLDAAVVHIRPDTNVSVEAQLRFGLAMMHNDCNLQLAHAALETAAGLYRQVGDHKRLGRSLQYLAFVLLMLGGAEDAEKLLDEARDLLEGSGSQRALAALYSIQVIILSRRHDYDADAAREAAQNAARIYEAIGADRSAFAARSNLIETELCQGRFATAIADAHTLAARLRATAQSGVLGVVLKNLCAALVRTGRFAEALEVAQEAAPLLPDYIPSFILLDHLALCRAMMGCAEEAAMLTGFADHAYQERGWPRQPVEQLAAAGSHSILKAALPATSLVRRLKDGARLTQDGAWAIAVRADTMVPGGPAMDQSCGPAGPKRAS